MQVNLAPFLRMAVSVLFLWSTAHAATDLQRNASGLRANAGALANEIREYLQDTGKGTTGTDGELWKNVSSLERAAKELDEVVDQRGDGPEVTALITEITTFVRGSRASMAGLPIGNSGQQALYRCEGFVMALRNLTGAKATEEKPNVAREFQAEVKEAWGSQNYRNDNAPANAEVKQAPKASAPTPPAATPAPEAKPTPVPNLQETHAIGYGNRQGTIANSTARRYVSRKYNVPQEKLITRKIEQAGTDNLRVTIAGPTSVYIVDVNTGSNAVTNEKLKRR